MDNIRVLIDEEYGYRMWYWDARMSKEDLINWWTDLKTVEPYFFSPEKLPGVVRLIGDDEVLENNPNAPKMHLHMDDDSWLKVDGAILHHAGHDNTDFVTGA